MATFISEQAAWLNAAERAPSESLRHVNLLISGDLEEQKFVDFKLAFWMGLIYAIVQFMLVWTSRIIVIEPIARVLLRRYGEGPDPVKAKKLLKAKVQKFAQSTTEMLTYGIYTLVGCHVLRHSDWIWPSVNWWVECGDGPHANRHKIFKMEEVLLCYYLLYGSRYLQAAVCVLMEHKRKDFLEMMLHHIVTFVLISQSFYVGYFRAGAVIMLVFDPADVPLHVAKQCKYLGLETLADIFFVLFMLAFLITRIIMFPYIIWSAHFEIHNYIKWEYFDNGGEWSCICLCDVLMVLNLYWFWLILKVLWQVITKGTVDDVRSDDEEEEEDEKKRK